MTDAAIITVIVLIGLLAAAGFTLWLLLRRMGRLREVLDETEERRREISNFLARFSSGIQGEDGVDGAMHAAALHICEQTDAESVGIYELNGDELNGAGVCGTYPLIHSRNKLVFSRHRYLLEALRREQIRVGKGFLGGMVVTRHAELVPNGSQDARFQEYPDHGILGSVMAVPMLRDGLPVGIICAVNNRLHPGKPFSDSQFERLRMLSFQVLMVHNLVKVYGEISRRDRIDQELQFARHLQQSLLPVDFPRWGSFAIDAFSRSAKEVNGDFYDFVPIDDDRLLVMVGDACGKGIPACMLTAMTRSIARSLVDNFTTLNDFLTTLSDKLNRDTDADRFITLGCCLLNRKDSLLEYGRAGHTDLISYVHNHIRIMSPEGTALGIMPAEFAVFDTICVALEPGTTIMLYSDGLTEAIDKEGVEFGQDQLAAAFRQACDEGASSREIIRSVMRQIVEYEVEQADDQTVVLIRCTECEQ